MILNYWNGEQYANDISSSYSLIYELYVCVIEAQKNRLQNTYVYLWVMKPRKRPLQADNSKSRLFMLVIGSEITIREKQKWIGCTFGLI